jgi:hypothetical protein
MTGLLTPISVAAQYMPETVDVRREYMEDITAPLTRFALVPTEEHESYLSGVRTLVTTESNDTNRYLLFVPEFNGEFPVWSAGSYIVRRRVLDGALDQVKIFLRSDPGFFVRIWPEGEQRSALSLYIAGVQVHRTVPLPIPVEQVVDTPFSEIVDLTQAQIDWDFVFPDITPGPNRTVADMAARARSMLSSLPDAEDGAMDADGNLVFIESLVLQDQQPGFNCSGFAKWIIDGLHMAQYGSFLPIEPLKEKHLDLRGHRWSELREDARDPYFGLDWTRNLATAMLSAAQGGRDVHPEAADVRDVPYANYVEDVGYDVARLPLVLYGLAVREPGNIYIGSFSREFGSPPLHQHVHVAVFFPYFDEAGNFFVEVMERNVETSLASVDRRYHNDSVHLVRVRASENYSPPVIIN